MAKKKSLTVPQNGTQPAVIPSPIDNMLSGNSTIGQTLKATAKRPTSFNIDPALLAQFKAQCATKGVSMSSVIENFMREFGSK